MTRHILIIASLMMLAILPLRAETEITDVYETIDISADSDTISLSHIFTENVTHLPIPTEREAEGAENSSISDRSIVIDGISAEGDTLDMNGHRHIETIYAFPQASQLSFQHRDWKRMWINGATLTGAFIAALTTMELLPDNTTAWSRADIRSTPFYKRWYRHVFKEGPDWDGDKAIFNLILHPYAGAVYFMGARSCGFSFWGSLAFCSVVSTVCWEFGIESCNERPSIQDIFITPLVGSAIGEGFFQLKRHIVNNDYRLFGSPVLGNVVAYIIDPVNEVVGLFAGNPARKYAKQRRMELRSMPTFSTTLGKPSYGFTIQALF